MTADLEQRVARLEAIEEIKRAKERYAKICDAGYSPDEVATVFTEDAVWDGGDQLGRHEGIEAIRRFFGETAISWAVHYMIAPAIDVNDDLSAATGTWYLFEPSIIDDTAIWIMARYTDKLVREEDGWKFKEMNVEPLAITPTREDWVSTKFWAP
jgi:hypothetical protein